MDKLTKKEKGFVKEYALTENGTQSALNHYDVEKENTAASIASENLRKPHIQAALEEVKRSLADRIPDDLLEKKHLALLHKLDEKGEIDVQAVKSGLEMGYKLKGAYAPERSISLDIHADIANPKAIELAQEYEARLKENL